MTFPAHQGLIFPMVRRWPNSFDGLALSVGAAMPDITDTTLGFPLNGYFKQWYGHSLIRMFTLDLVIGLLITWLIAVFARRLFRDGDVPRRLQAFFTKIAANDDPKGAGGRNKVPLRLWSFSVFIGILSHIGFDFASHDTNLLLYPWVESPHWLPIWWYTIWFEIRPLSIFGRSYAVGVFSVIWFLLTLIGIFLFIHFLSPKQEDRI